MVLITRLFEERTSKATFGDESCICNCKEILNEESELEPIIESTDFPLAEFTSEGSVLRSSRNDKTAAATTDWFDAKLIQEGQQYAKDNVLQLASSLAMGLFLGFCIPRANAVLMQEGSRLRRSTFLQRYLGIAAHVKLWIFSDMDGKSEGYRDVIRTRKLHLAYAKSFKAGATLPDLPPLDERQERLLAAVSSDLASVDLDLAPELLDYHPSVPMAQLDMGLTIFALYGFFALFPEDMGARGGPKSKGYGAFVHLCAVLGNLFGVEDRLNPALHYYRNADAKAQEGVGGCFLASLKHIDAYGMNSLIVTFRECSRFVPGLLRLHVFLYFVVNNLILRGRGLQAKAIRRELTKMDLFLYYIFCSTQRVLSRSEVIRTCANKLALLLVTILVKFYLWKFKRPTRKS